MNQAIENLPIYVEYVKERGGGTLKDLTGLKVGWLTVVSRAPNRRKEVMWNCLCKCGNARVVQSAYLRDEITRSCGCDNKHINGNRNPTYASYCAMLRRCHEPAEKMYYRYGGKGIFVCDRWRESYFNFLEDVGERPSVDFSIERIDGTKGYSKENCKWATAKEQAMNRKSTHWIEIDGERHTATDWAIIKGISKHTICARIRARWPGYEAVMTPVGKSGVRHRGFRPIAGNRTIENAALGIEPTSPGG